jgi:hypothetical protein
MASKRDIEIYVAVYGKHRHLTRTEAYHRVAEEQGITDGAVRAMAHRGGKEVEGQVALMRYISDSASKVNASTVQIEHIIQAGLDEIALHRERSQTRGGIQYAVFRSDVHLPLQHDAAMTLYLKLLRDINPTWISALNDTLDNPTLSRWEDRRRLSDRAFDDDLSNLMELHGLLMELEQDAAPNAAFPAVVGNHDLRFSNTENPTTTAYQTAKTMTELAEHGVLFSDTIARQNVFAVNERLYWTHGFSAAQRHTTRSNKNMEYTKTEAGITHDFDLVTGHVHKLDTTRTAYGTHYTSGCLCNLNPTYMRFKPAWDLGIVVSAFDPNSDWHHTTTLQLVDDAGILKTYWNNSLYTSE